MDLPAPAVLMMGIRTHSFLIYSIYSQPIERNINASDSSEISVTSVNSLFPAALFRKRNFTTWCSTSNKIIYSFKLRFSGLIRKFKKNESFKKLYKDYLKIGMKKILGGFEYNVRIFGVKLGDNPI